MDERTEYQIADKVYALHVDSGVPVRDLMSKQRFFDLVCGSVEHLGLSIDEAAAHSEDDLLSMLTDEYAKQPHNNQLRQFLGLKLEDSLGL